jgi:hypothetical protein
MGLQTSEIGALLPIQSGKKFNSALSFVVLLLMFSYFVHSTKLINMDNK